jgi:hypothetical protein
MSCRRIGQEALILTPDQQGWRSSLDNLARLIDWAPGESHLEGIHAAAKGEPAWPPLALFKAMLIAVWYDLSDVKLAEALDNRASFRRLCGFFVHEPTPERTTCQSALNRDPRSARKRGSDAVLVQQGHGPWTSHASSRSSLARPYICRLTIFNLMIWPSTCRLDQGEVMAASTAA